MSILEFTNSCSKNIKDSRDPKQNRSPPCKGFLLAFDVMHLFIRRKLHGSGEKISRVKYGQKACGSRYFIDESDMNSQWTYTVPLPL
jgi:hypothetical protein